MWNIQKTSSLLYAFILLSVVIITRAVKMWQLRLICEALSDSYTSTFLNIRLDGKKDGGQITTKTGSRDYGTVNYC